MQTTFEIKDDFYLNGERVVFNKDCTDDLAFWVAEISDYVKQGKNYYEVKMPWHQSEETYYALFGVNVAGSLKNCVVYESDKYAGTPMNIASKRMLDSAGVRYYQYQPTGRKIELDM